MVERFAIGQGVARLEDPRLLKGGGRYMDDLQIPELTHGYILRSPHAHARIVCIDTEAAAKMPGVLAVLSGADWLADGLGPVSCEMPLKRPDGGPFCSPPNYPLVADKARMVGDYIALVVAETARRDVDLDEQRQRAECEQRGGRRHGDRERHVPADPVPVKSRV